MDTVINTIIPVVQSYKIINNACNIYIHYAPLLQLYNTNKYIPSIEKKGKTTSYIQLNRKTL